MKIEITHRAVLRVWLDLDLEGRDEHYRALCEAAELEAEKTEAFPPAWPKPEQSDEFGPIGWDYFEVSDWADRVSSVLARKYDLEWESCNYDGLEVTLTTDNDSLIFDAFLKEFRAALEPVKRWIKNWED